jgi:hypothetical protein
MSLYYVGAVTLYGKPEDPRISYKVFRVSDTVRIGRSIAWQGLRHLESPATRSPYRWLAEALEQAPLEQ